MAKSEKDRQLFLIETLNGLSLNIDLLLQRFKNKYRENGGESHSRSILYLKWSSELQQAQMRVEKVTSELNELESRQNGKLV
jgi:hypothetical protein